MDQIKPYNPLDKRHLGESVAEALLRSPIHPMSSIPEFVGAGVYAIYYTGEFKPYSKISEQNKEEEYSLPIYVGKAVPAGARKGGLADGAPHGKALYKRLNEHAKSIEVVGNLDLTDFACRFLVVDEIWIPLGESLLISKFKPLWNQLIDGFGNHTPGNGRFNQARSRWDTLHVGREWAAKCQERGEKAETISNEIASHLRVMYG
ncbi:Eco29kI family restriction endonuclease [Sneathiella aquimaris]|uniref:Eco29kI family restriction endonuclease n=1 Tax=Sneathiella aquimaris TaxID=2599305 RepID=UPI00146CDAB4|nr:Eco29kI family restriction endonuclease [Sneathiella aquimaris]